jgi:hypothetical protein
LPAVAPQSDRFAALAARVRARALSASAMGPPAD